MIDKRADVCNNDCKLKIAFDRGAGFISNANALRQMSLRERKYRRRDASAPKLVFLGRQGIPAGLSRIAESYRTEK